MATISINEVRRRLSIFAKEHVNDTDEKQHAQQFWRDFYQCFGLSKSSASMFEARVSRLGGKRGFIDSFIPGLLLVEHKSYGESLEKAYEQAQTYFHGIVNEFEKPKYIITCDFKTFHLYILDSDSEVNVKEPHVCKLEELHTKADWFMFLADKKVEAITEETPINRKAAYQISVLHQQLIKSNFSGRDLEIFLTRLLFCLFADDTGIFGEDGQFTKLIDDTKEDGSDTGITLALFFQILNTPHNKRQINLDERLKQFEYVNGSLFEENTQIPYFDYELRKLLVECNRLDWSAISPAIFGAMFQGVLETNTSDTAHRKESRRELGAHYTSERNILKVIEPLFLNELRQEFEACKSGNAKNSRLRLEALYNKLPTLTFFDPACGCGNFLVIAYRELRRLENDIIEQFFKTSQRGLLDISTLCRVNVSQFYGIEIDEAAAHIARVAMYITDHQLNLEAANRFGETRATVPLISTPHIRCDNALTTDWNTLISKDVCSYILGNPPFIGKQYQTAEQKNDLELIASDIKNYGLLDYVCGWYIKATNYISGTTIPVAFVSTNSITQGEQVAVLWSWMLNKGVRINFAHRTFRWSNEGKAVAAVHCVIVGFSLTDSISKFIFDYANGIGSEPTSIKVSTINPYLLEAPLVVLENRKNPICNVPNIVFGSMANDGGNLLLSTEEKDKLISSYPQATNFIRRFVGSEEFINDIDRWCLWLKDIQPDVIKQIPPVYERVMNVKKLREQSQRESTRNLALTPYLFGEIRQPEFGSYLLIPRVSSERRTYIPIGFLNFNVVASDATLIIPNASLYHFSVLNSSLHNAWMRIVCGRLKSDYRYSNGIVYNNFVWVVDISVDMIAKLEATAQLILDARSLYPNSSLASLYDPLTMPVELLKAHQANNKLVDIAYGYKGKDDDASRAAFLFTRYEKLTSLLPSVNVKKQRSKKT